LPNSKISRTTPETQEQSRWLPPGGTLGALVTDARRRAGGLDTGESFEVIRARRQGIPKLSGVLPRSTVGVIAEIKRSSPSKGQINPKIDSALRAMSYEKGGAVAISVLTEPTQFGGSDDDLREVVAEVAIPVLKKDFHVDEKQIVQAAFLGASAALVIVRAVEPRFLRRIASVAAETDIELLYEVRDEAELERALEVGAEIIGVNNRDLETLAVDPETVSRIVPMIPPECIAVAESGYVNVHDVEMAALAGADAVLIGSSLSASADPARAVRALSSIPRHRRTD
jgi:indole-3-glycerol phosphate synthase